MQNMFSVVRSVCLSALLAIAPALLAVTPLVKAHAQQVTVTVAPSTATVPVNLTQQFTFTLTPPPQFNATVTWTVSGGGTIDHTGLYTAPSSVPSGAVTVTATRTLHPMQFGTATVTVINNTNSISGNVSGANNVSVALTGTASANTTTDGSGNYSFGGLLDGSYTVTPSLAGYILSPSSLNETISGASVTGVNFTATHNTLRTDLNIVQYPNPLPNWGGLYGANTIATDPDFGTRLLRVSDGATDGYKSIQTADSSQAGLWNADSTMLLVRSAHSMLYQFDHATFQAKKLAYFTFDQVQYSHVNAALLFTLNGTVLSANTFTKVNGDWTFSTSSVVFDFAAALPSGFVVKSSSVFNISYEDSTITMGFSDGAQNTGIYVVAWRQGSGYRILNLNTGAITGQWGATGQAVISSPNYSLPMTFHEVYMTLNPAYAVINPKGASDTSLVWDIATLNLTDNQSAGHKAYGRAGIFSGGPGGGQLNFGLYTSPATHTFVVLPQNLPAAVGQSYKEDMHMGFGLIDPNDQAILWASSSGNGAIPFVSAWENEVRGYDPVLGIVYRLCHTFDSEQSLEFIVLNATTVASPDGKYVAFTSDIEGALGSTSGGAVGTLGVDARGDVFIAEVTRQH